MNLLKKLAAQTAVYGFSSILVRLLNPLLVPLHTRVFTQGEYGTITEMYAYVTFLVVVLAYGMETAFFRHSEKENNPDKAFSTAFLSLLFSSLTFIALVSLFSPSIAAMILYPNNPEYIILFALILGMDAISAIPFARLRQQNRAVRFAVIKTVNIATNILFNLFFLLPALSGDHQLFSSVGFTYHPETGVTYVFLANLFASGVTLLLLLPEILGVRFHFDARLWRSMLTYGLPLLVAGLAGMVNETIDRILLKYLLPYPTEENLKMVGIYGACYKLSIFITLAIQAFRYAAEPFFFAQAKQSNAKQVYADVLKYFTIATAFIFLVVMVYIDVFKHFIGENYHEGLGVVPILLLANVFLGIYYNLSVWYKLTDRTLYGAWIAIGGAIITLALNIWLIPILGYWGSAWATLACYATMAAASFLLGQKFYPVPYNIPRVLFYIGLAIGLYFLHDQLAPAESSPVYRYGLATLAAAVYACIAYILERGRKAVS